jgi:hypothetical protein
MAKEKIVATEVAETEFARFLDAMGLEERCNEKALDADDFKAFLANKGEIIRAIERGQLVVDPKGQAVFSPTNGGDELTFHEPLGEDIAVMDQAREGRGAEKQNKCLAAMTGTIPGRFLKLPLRDYRVCVSIMLLFLA